MASAFIKWISSPWFRFVLICLWVGQSQVGNCSFSQDKMLGSSISWRAKGATWPSKIGAVKSGVSRARWCSFCHSKTEGTKFGAQNLVPIWNQFGREYFKRNGMEVFREVVSGMETPSLNMEIFHLFFSKNLFFFPGESFHTALWACLGFPLKKTCLKKWLFAKITFFFQPQNSMVLLMNLSTGY